MFDPPGFRFGIWHAIETLFAAIGAILGLLIAVAVIVLLVRYLIVATKAAEIYVAQHGQKPYGMAAISLPPEPGPLAPSAPEPVAAEPVEPVGAPEPTQKPAPRTRTPKLPPPSS